MRISSIGLSLSFLLCLFNACDKATEDSKPENNDNKPALCSDINAELKTRCIGGAAKEGDCVVSPYNSSLCVKKGTEQEWLKDKTCAQIHTEACRGAVVGVGDSRQVCRKAGNGLCENAPSYALYTPKCKARGLTDLNKSVAWMCNQIPAASCDGDVVTFEALWASMEPSRIKTKLCKVENNKCVPDLSQNAEGVASYYCGFDIAVRQADLEEDITDKSGTGLKKGYTVDACQNKAVLSAKVGYRKTMMDNPSRASLLNICEADISTKE